MGASHGGEDTRPPRRDSNTVAPSGNLNPQVPAGHAPLVWAVLSFLGYPFQVEG